MILWYNPSIKVINNIHLLIFDIFALNYTKMLVEAISMSNEYGDISILFTLEGKFQYRKKEKKCNEEDSIRNVELLRLKSL